MSEETKDQPIVEKTEEEVFIEDMGGELEEITLPKPEDALPAEGDEDQGVTEDESETKPETPEGETKVETDADPLSTLMTETNLDKTYKTPEEVLRAMPGTQAELQRRGQEAQCYNE